MRKIKSLSDICLTFEECELLDNREDSALCWVYNTFKVVAEWELTPVKSLVKLDHDQLLDILKRYREVPGWELHPVEVFVAQEQIEELIKKKVFYYAPLKKVEQGIINFSE